MSTLIMLDNGKLSDAGLMHLHVDALFTRDAQGDLLRSNEPSAAPAPRFFLGLTRDGPLVRFRGDVRNETRRELEDAVTLEILNDLPTVPETYQEILAATAPVTHTSAGPAFIFPDVSLSDNESLLITDDTAHYLEPLLAAWIPDVAIGRPMYAMIVDGRAVSVCCSVRITDRACEAGVETAPAARGHGYAAKVVAAWANAIRGSGKIPLYSTSWTNDASRAVARKVGLRQYGTTLHIT